jgi:hypothetical protein
MVLTRHTQVENLMNLLRVRRQASTVRHGRQAAYVGLAAAILDVPPGNLDHLLVRADGPTTVAPAAAIAGHTSRAA